MQQSATVHLWKPKQQQNSNKPRCRLYLSLAVVTLSLLWVQFVLYQRIQHNHNGGSLLRRVGGEVEPTSSLSSSRVNQQQQQEASIKHDNDDTDDDPHLAMPSKTALPDWIQHYVAWHKSMRLKYPGKALWDDPDAPKLLIRTCLGLCGGLNDRLGQLPWDLYLANQTNRVLLMHWHRPVPLERFLIPHGDLDWRVPEDVPGFFPAKHERAVPREGLPVIRQGVKDMFEDYPSANPTMEFWANDFPLALERVQRGALASEKILRHRLLGHLHEQVLEDRLRDLGETDMIHGTATFGNIFHLFFKLAPPIQAILDDIYRSLDLQIGSYSAVHCRVRHPKAVVGLVKGKNENYPADKTGLPWEGETRENAIATAVRALRCAQTLQDVGPKYHTTEPIYFFSDSNDLVRYMSSELYNETFVDQHRDEFSTSTIQKNALAISQAVKILARPSDQENAHIDRQKGRTKEHYYGTFLDLFLAINARCVTYGIGFYAVFATKISHVPCKLLYQEEAWGGNERKRQHVPLCHLEKDAKYLA